jgi:type II secretory pathway pseudopilin PulG
VVKRVLLAKEMGESLVEILVAVAIMAIVLTIFLSALSTGASSVAVVHERVTAENIARSQLEHVKNSAFVIDTDHYTPTAILHTGYSAVISATPIITDLQLITVTIFHNGEPVFRIEDYKVNR